jgi:ataxin-10
MSGDGEWSQLLGKLRDSRTLGSEHEQEKLVHSLIQSSLDLENRKSMVKADVEMISELLSDWSETYIHQLTHSTTPTSIATAVMNAIKLLRNLCAGVPDNQTSILSTNVLTSLASLITTLTEHISHRHTPTPSLSCSPDKIVTTTLQLLGNLCVGFPEGQAQIWKTVFPQILKSILEVCNEVDMVCMILHNCTCVEELGANRRNDLIASSEGLAILSHVIPSPSDDSGMEWRSIFLQSFVKLTCFQTLHKCLVPSHHSLWVSVVELAGRVMGNDEAEGVWSTWDESECVYLVMVWRSDVEMMLANDAAILKECAKDDTNTVSPNTHRIVEGVRAVLRLLCALSIRPATLPLLQTQEPLMETALALLRQLSVLDGSSESGKHRSNLKEAEMIGTDMEGVLFGLKRDLLQLISNLLYHCPQMQVKVRELKEVSLLLNQCHIDHSNPYILQWAILAIRNLCEDNPANQQLIAQLETQGIAEAASQLEFGCEVEIGADGRLKLKP